MVVYLESVVLALACLGLVSIVWSTLRLGISPMPTSGAVKREVLAIIPSTLEGEVHELGAGWGTLAVALAAHCPRARIIAWEASLFPWAFCWLRLRLQPRANLDLRRADFMGADFRGARLVMAYLWTGAMRRLAVKFEAELSAGAEVVTHTFAWPGRRPDEVHRAKDLYQTPVYRYVVERRRSA